MTTATYDYATLRDTIRASVSDTADLRAAHAANSVLRRNIEQRDALRAQLDAGGDGTPLETLQRQIAIRDGNIRDAREQLRRAGVTT